MVNVGSEEIKTMFVGDMGIKTAAIGDEKIYERVCSYVYIQLISDDGEAE